MTQRRLSTNTLPAAAVDGLLRRLEAGADPHALLIVRNGETVFEAEWAPYRRDQPALVYSVSKTFTSVAIGLLAAEGRLMLDDSVGALLDRPNPHGITVRHLLTMNTGHSPEQIERELRFDVERLLTVAPQSRPGTRFAYNSDATFALSCIVTALTGERLTDYLRPRLLDPLGIPDRWMKPLAGIEQGFSGFHLTVDDIARLARLLAEGGMWEGAQLVPADYVRELSEVWSDTADPAAPAGDQDDWARGYGYQVWRSRHGFRLDGAYGQFGLILPDEGIVIAYQGATLETAETLAAFWEFIERLDDPGAEGSDTVVTPQTLDAWDARTALTAAPDGGADAAGWALVDDGDRGWTLTRPAEQTPAGDIAVGRGAWVTTVLAADVAPPALQPPAPLAGPAVTAGTVLPVAARGEDLADGVVRVHLVNTTSPHRLLIERDARGALTVRWHTVPLQGRGLDTLLVPPGIVG